MDFLWLWCEKKQVSSHVFRRDIYSNENFWEDLQNLLRFSWLRTLKRRTRVVWPSLEVHVVSSLHGNDHTEVQWSISHKNQILKKQTVLVLLAATSSNAILESYSLEVNIAPENKPSQKKEPNLPTIIFQGLCETSGGVALNVFHVFFSVSTTVRPWWCPVQLNQKFSQEIVAIKAASWDSARLTNCGPCITDGPHKKSWLNDPINDTWALQEMPEGMVIKITWALEITVLRPWNFLYLLEWFDMIRGQTLWSWWIYHCCGNEV